MALIPASDMSVKEHTSLSDEDLIKITTRSVAIAKADADRKAFAYGSSFITSADPDGGFWTDLGHLMWDELEFGPVTTLLLAECAARNIVIDTSR